MSLTASNVFLHDKGHGSLELVRFWLLEAPPFADLPMEGQNASGRNRDVVRVGVLLELAVAIEGDLCHIQSPKDPK